MKTLNKQAASFTAALSLVFLLPFLAACHQVPYCVGSCGPDTQEEGDAAESPELPDGMEGDAMTDAPPPDGEGTDGTEAADHAEIELQDIPPDGCIPCEFTYPGCIEGRTCCDGEGKETCNLIDDDCDGAIDEDIDFDTNARHCGECNHSCTLPHAETACQGGGCVFLDCLSYFADCVADNPSDPATLGCETYCVQTAEEDTVCDMIDNDCDCQVDEDIDLTTDPDNCGACGTRCRFPHATGECFSPDGTPESALCRIASCNAGYYDVDPDAPGCEYACAACEYTVGGCQLGHTCCTSSGQETCNGLDDECSGEIDEGNPEGGSSCGNTVGECRPGTLTCIDGSLGCQGGVLPAQEACDGRDNDCDGATDEPDAGDTYLHDENQPCGDTSLGDCELGTTRCVAGVLECQGYIGPSPEQCDGHDNDCDGSVDESPIPGEGAACGSSVGECRQGTTICQPGTGAWVCQGGTGPTVEVCDSRDNDCSGVVDDPFNLNVDPNNCGTCGRRCSTIVGPHTIYICSSGTCTVIGCEEGYWDNDSDPLTCEYACTYTGSEICDGLDNDCNGLTDTADPGMAIPSNFCSQIGACAGSSPACTTHGTTTKWYCSYGPYVSLEADFETLRPESDCDGRDNDCDGAVDDAFPLKGTSCSSGDGLCRRTGTYVCKTSQDGIECTAVAGTPQPETCNGTDDNCDTIVDNFGETAWGIIGAQAVTGSGAQYVFRYEASRPDAGACAQGTQSGTGPGLVTKACSKTGVQPWTSLDWTTALEACCNLNSDGVCHYGAGVPQRWNLCTAPVWEEVCESQGQNYAYPYGNTYQPNSCNGNDYDTNCPCPGPSCTSTVGDQDEILAAGSLAACCSNWGGCVYDMSGNVKEWSYTQRGAGYREIRGGSSNAPYSGLTCQFSFTIGAEDFLFYNLGFRCCYY